MTMNGLPKNFITQQRLVEMNAPYHFQRARAGAHSAYPRPAQPNTNQPNTINRPRATKQREYWDEVYSQYLARRSYQPLERTL